MFLQKSTFLLSALGRKQQNLNRLNLWRIQVPICYQVFSSAPEKFVKFDDTKKDKS